jgi:hypothetical protein
MLHLLQFPYNGEPPKRLVTSKPVTPNPLHFVRNHGGIPIIDKEKFSMTLDGLVANPKVYSLDDLMDESKFPRMEKVVTMQVSVWLNEHHLLCMSRDLFPQHEYLSKKVREDIFRLLALRQAMLTCDIRSALELVG